MNGQCKFHKANGPAFNKGEIWYPASGGNYKTIIDSVRNFGTGKWDYEVSYYYEDDTMIRTKDAWNFQVRYYHQADKTLKVKMSVDR